MTHRATACVSGCRTTRAALLVNADMKTSWRIPGRDDTACAVPSGVCVYRAVERKLRSRRLLLTTKTEENAIAAPASIGLS
ncbi:hypothetical protein, partial [Nocardia amamiensis]|uniref:hypothetical protein n=1 Tax=Nocardia amamiensis TaxID=404578 RepID=UPI0033E3DC97